MRSQIMAGRQRIILQTLAYTLYGFGVFLVFLYVNFPYDVLRQHIVDRFPREDLQLTIASLRPDFPPGVQFRQVRLLSTQALSSTALAQIDTLQAQPNFFAILSSMLDFHLDARLYSGHLEGNVRTAVADEASPWEIQARFSDVHVEQHPLVQKDNKAFLRGRLEGDVVATLDSTGLLQQGFVNLRLQPLVFTGNELQLPLPQEISCDSLQSQLQLKTGQLHIASFNCRGDDLTIQVRGNVQWQQPLRNSLLDLNIQMRSETTYKQELDLIGTLIRRRPDRRGILSFSIRGTLQQPRFGV
jgi:type II secretion system protein N